MRPEGNAAVLIAYNQRAAFDNTRRVWAALSVDPCCTVRQLTQDLDLAPDTIIRAFERLRDAGYIEYEPYAVRARRVLVPFIITGRKGEWIL